MHKKYQKSGFTLIELLVVIGIISLLVSIILPSFNKARQLAKSAACKVTLKGLGSAVDIYRTEFKSFPQVARNPSLNTNSDLSAMNVALSDYASDKANYRCPADDGPVENETDKSYYGNKSYWDVEDTSYFIHEMLVDNYEFFEHMLNRHGGQEVWIMTEYDHFHGDALKVGNRNFAFADGHVGDIVEEDVIDYENESTE